MSLRRSIEIYGMPVISILLALFLWFFVANQKIKSWTYPVEVYVKTASSDISGWSIPEKVYIELKGPSRVLDRITNENLGLKIALAEIQAGQYTRSIQQSMISGVPNGVEIVKIDPAEVRIELRPLIEIRYRVAPQFASLSDSSLELGQIVDVDPRYVELRGMRELLQDITEIQTEPIEIEKRIGKHEANVSLIVPKETRVFPQTVRVSYEVISKKDSEGRNN